MPHKDLPIRPLVRAFDPVGGDTLGKPELDFASLFREENVPEDAPLTLYPEDLGVPWHTSFPWVRQSKFWALAEEAGRDFITRISLDKASDRGRLPVEMDDDRRKGKIDELVENAVSCVTYLYPTSSPIRLALLAQSIILLFLHDDVMERGETQDDMTVVDELLTMAPKNQHLKRFCTEVLEEDPVLGLDLITAIHAWVRDGRVQSPFKQDHYAYLSDYMVYRRNDIGKQFMVAAVRFGCGVHQTPEELAPFEELTDLFTTHSILLNDLYSYDKEVYESKKLNGSIVNAVHVTKQLLSVSPASAKNITRVMSWDMEKEFYAISEKFMRDPSINHAQRVYITGLLDATIGNIFHSATLSRYVRHAPEPLPCTT
ncbi:Terpene cyclase 6 [Fusarium torreyae]|uniref:Terpene synthase n=1 Tax=Fusarium torreyae TaxID=1237075 RepID=A0A9W8VFD8_9HYPO|nr:Terpene cyclase 6 [Fusarium torreyae]